MMNSCKPRDIIPKSRLFALFIFLIFIQSCFPSLLLGPLKRRGLPGSKWATEVLNNHPSNSWIELTSQHLSTPKPERSKNYLEDFSNSDKGESYTQSPLKEDNLRYGEHASRPLSLGSEELSTQINVDPTTILSQLDDNGDQKFIHNSEFERAGSIDKPPWYKNVEIIEDIGTFEERKKFWQDRIKTSNAANNFGTIGLKRNKHERLRDPDHFWQSMFSNGDEIVEEDNPLEASAMRNSDLTVPRTIRPKIIRPTVSLQKQVGVTPQLLRSDLQKQAETTMNDRLSGGLKNLSPRERFNKGSLVKAYPDKPQSLDADTSLSIKHFIKNLGPEIASTESIDKNKLIRIFNHHPSLSNFELISTASSTGKAIGGSRTQKSPLTISFEETKPDYKITFTILQIDKPDKVDEISLLIKTQIKRKFNRNDSDSDGFLSIFKIFENRRNKNRIEHHDSDQKIRKNNDRNLVIYDDHDYEDYEKGVQIKKGKITGSESSSTTTSAINVKISKKLYEKILSSLKFSKSDYDQNFFATLIKMFKVNCEDLNKNRKVIDYGNNQYAKTSVGDGRQTEGVRIKEILDGKHSGLNNEWDDLSLFSNGKATYQNKLPRIDIIKEKNTENLKLYEKLKTLGNPKTPASERSPTQNSLKQISQITLINTNRLKRFKKILDNKRNNDLIDLNFLKLGYSTQKTRNPRKASVEGEKAKSGIFKNPANGYNHDIFKGFIEKNRRPQKQHSSKQYPKVGKNVEALVKLFEDKAQNLDPRVRIKNQIEPKKNLEKPIESLSSIKSPGITENRDRIFSTPMPHEIYDGKFKDFGIKTIKLDSNRKIERPMEKFSSNEISALMESQDKILPNPTLSEGSYKDKKLKPDSNDRVERPIENVSPIKAPTINDNQNERLSTPSLVQSHNEHHKNLRIGSNQKFDRPVEKALPDKIRAVAENQDKFLANPSTIGIKNRNKNIADTKESILPAFRKKSEEDEGKSNLFHSEVEKEEPEPSSPGPSSHVKIFQGAVITNNREERPKNDRVAFNSVMDENEAQKRLEIENEREKKLLEIQNKEKKREQEEELKIQEEQKGIKQQELRIQEEQQLKRQKEIQVQNSLERMRKLNLKSQRELKNSQPGLNIGGKHISFYPNALNKNTIKLKKEEKLLKKKKLKLESTKKKKRFLINFFRKRMIEPIRRAILNGIEKFKQLFQKVHI